MIPRPCLFLASILLASPALADTSVSYRLPTGAILIEENARGTMRLNFGKDTYILVAEGRAYLSDSSGRKPRVRDLTSLVHRFSPMVALLRGLDTGSNTANVRFTALQDKATVAGFSGRRLAVTGLGTDAPVEIVATDDPAAAAAGQLVGRLIRNLADQVRQADPRIATAMLPELDRLGGWQRELGTVLRIAEKVELASLSEAEIAPERFTLPAVPDTGKADARIAERPAKKAR
ncbi:MAG: hypothetical protein ACK5SX_03060 [Sandaracinobacter sp.]